VNVDQAFELRQGLRPLATTYAETDDLRISSIATGSTDGDTTKQPKGFVFSVISPTKGLPAPGGARPGRAGRKDFPKPRNLGKAGWVGRRDGDVPGATESGSVPDTS
jgi:hypothetical protein